MEFRGLGSEKYFPPIIPNGEIHGYAPGQQRRNFLHLMTVRDDGLELAGVFISWLSVDGVSMDDSCVVIHSTSYRNGGFSFDLGGMLYREDWADDFCEYVQGYPVVYALMNRITFELQRLDTELDVF